MRLAILIVSLLLPVTVRAQVLAPSPPPPVNQDGMKDFCIYGNRIYSLGAQLCVPDSNAGLRCVASEGSKSDGRAFWSFDSKERPAFQAGAAGAAVRFCRLG